MSLPRSLHPLMGLGAWGLGFRALGFRIYGYDLEAALCTLRTAHSQRSLDMLHKTERNPNP